ncbi:uncharacterized protein [Drosophila bipectinata]|uniref:uncharacterized protein n=1 Tax=Drosophila bipectinata TaxID=42026 RepID=UPI001C890794|nr:uncharacterized protein LOC108126755 [Drosophila bipectinata]
MDNLKHIGRHLIMRICPFFVLASYFLEVIYTLVNMEHVGKTRAVVLDSHIAFSYIYTSFDILLNIVAIALIVYTRAQESGVSILLVGRVIHRILFTLWTMFFYFLLDDSFDVGCLLLLLAVKVKEKKRQDLIKIDSLPYQLLLLLGRLCICSMFVIWQDETSTSIIFVIIIWSLLFPLFFGLSTELFSILTICAILYHDIYSNQSSFISGWDDWFLSMEYFLAVLSKVGAFLMLSVLGGGKWSIDGFRNRKAEKQCQKSGYRLIKTQTAA